MSIPNLLRWKEFASWSPILGDWLAEQCVDGYEHLLRSFEPKPEYIDDPVWLEEVLQSVLTTDVKHLVDDFALRLAKFNVHAFHGCRVKDASTFHREGIHQNDPESLERQTRSMVSEEQELSFLRPNIERIISNFDSRERDTGKVWLSLDEAILIEGGAGHYLIYGSEWIFCLLGPDAHKVLRSRGVPTIVDIRLPLKTQKITILKELAQNMLHEWTRAMVEKRTDGVRDIDFSFSLNEPVPANWVIGHHHPRWINDPHYLNIRRKTENTSCPACRR